MMEKTNNNKREKDERLMLLICASIKCERERKRELDWGI
jgi:hypothetical protein